MASTAIWRGPSVKAACRPSARPFLSVSVAPTYRAQPRDVCRRAAEEGAPATAPAPADADLPAPAAAAAAAAPANDWSDEVVFYEGSGSNIELVLSILLSATLIYAPLTLASVGRRLWITIKVTNKRIVVTNTSPAFKNQTQVAFSQIKEVRMVPRAFGAWGDMVVFLKDKSRLELVGLERCEEIKRHIDSYIS
ncbi:hypothetical protein MNEG_3056 [Monoraphidium neglectum]|uniref:YdbS-like PH domain-containing protein n=1 Tax=Monoraphidium neglectum TaxID=145388 RepID=A0A0D2LDW8_9CHLO|nr:hypothetical protein MNEG_3056 [Monoraphidium neglectum]KIZ04899.1 hypothetical protein MNEG_3056 [Monoraphidium neglectum]|eukprot:XP_013903918.1 hypothetical protein MNEG_3056 [Monoraphidium neglectum]